MKGNQKKRRWRVNVAVAVALFCGVAVVVGITQVFKPISPNSYAKLVSLNDDDLMAVDIARMNLLCAQGLPGSQDLDIQKSLDLFDQWAELVQRNEQKYSAQFFRDRQSYDNSYAKFLAVNLGLTLKDDLGCGYNKALVGSGVMRDVQSTRFFRDSKDLFLYGFVENRKGSCSSLPVLMVAVGRRCGYPLHLVACKGHLFCRWDDGTERFNIETACEGVDSKPDSHYKSWPHPSSDQEIRDEKYLKNLTSAEELGVFCQIRAACLQENQCYDEAAEAYRQALRAFPDSKLIKRYLSSIENKEAK